MKSIKLPKGGKKRTAFFAAVAAVFVAVVLCIGVLLPYALQAAAVWADLTPEGLYTVTKALENELADLEQDVEIIFCADPDYLLGNYEARYVYIMARKLAKKNPHITVKHLDVLNDPSAADAYRANQASSIAWNDVIVASPARYKVLSASSFWGYDAEAEDNTIVSFNGEYRMANAILSVTAYADGAYAYFVKGHGERYYVKGDAGSDPDLSVFADLLQDTGLKVGVLDLDEIEAVPENCVLLIFCGTTVDYDDVDNYDYAHLSAIEKVDRYLAKHKSVMVFRDALAPEMPAFNEFLAEWGFAFDQTQVIDVENSMVAAGGTDGERVIADYPDKDTSAIGYSMFSAIIDLASAPKTVLANVGSIHTTRTDPLVSVSRDTTRNVSAVFYGSSTAFALDENGYKQTLTERPWLAAVGAEAKLQGGVYLYSYVFGAASTEMISNAYLTDSVYGNGDIMFSILRTLGRTDVVASADVGSADINEATYGGKLLVDTALSDKKQIIYDKNYTQNGKTTTYYGMTTGAQIAWTLVLILIPSGTVAFVGVYVCVRRKHR